MPITTIITQPAANSINAAYRPVIVAVSASATDGDPIPPVVYCDIYFAAVFYKTLSRTQYNETDGSSSLFIFDLQDACQEFLGQFIGENGGDAIVEAAALVTRVTCKFRSSGIDADGFTVPEGTPPIQGTFDEDPVSGTGDNSNDFYVVNASLRHEDNQSLAAHLDIYKNGTWGAATWPLTHRPFGYFLCRGDSDFMPILTDGTPTALILNYTNNDGTSGSTDPAGVDVDEDEDGDDGGSACTPVSGTPAFPNATSGVVYNYVFHLNGDGPFVLEDVTGLPSWMSANLVGANITFTGTPEEADEGPGIDVAFTVSNCAGVNEVDFSDTINVVANYLISSSFTMVIESVTGSNVPSLPPASANETGHHGVMSGTYVVTISGTPPLTLSVEVRKNGTRIPSGCQAVPSAGTYNFTISATESDLIVIAIFSGTC